MSSFFCLVSIVKCLVSGVDCLVYNIYVTFYEMLVDELKGSEVMQKEPKEMGRHLVKCNSFVSEINQSSSGKTQ